MNTQANAKASVSRCHPGPQETSISMMAIIMMAMTISVRLGV
jgi:hypothetical protein